MADFSFVVPVYKVPYNFLQNCIDSILCQTYKNIELVLVDDGSPDDCSKICDENAIKDSRIKVVHKKNGGLSDARNAGTKVVTSSWVTYVDGDDWVDKDFVEFFLNRISSESVNADIYIYAGYRDYATKCVKPTQYFIDGTRFVSRNERENLQKECCRVLTKKSQQGLFIGSACGKVYRTDYLRKNQLEFSIVPYGEDSIFYFHSIEKAEIVEYVFKAVYHYRDTEGSMVNGFRKNADVEQDVYLNELFSFARICNKSDEFVDYLYYRVMISMQRIISQKFYNPQNELSLYRKQKQTLLFFSKSPYKEVFKHVNFWTLNRNGKIKYLLLYCKLYFLLDISRSLYLKRKGTVNMKS